MTESADDRYEKQDPQNVYVEDGKVAAVTFRNILKKGNLKIVKTSDDGIVENIEFTVTGENFSKTAKTNALYPENTPSRKLPMKDMKNRNRRL